MSRGIVLVTGGARSGKSGFALGEASGREGRKVFIATAEALDDEMRERIARHRKERADGWDTVEEPVDIARAIDEVRGKYGAAVIDCLTLWLSNVICRGMNAEDEGGRLAEAVESAGKDMRLYLVTNEVGMGIVPDNELARTFRDAAGRMNQMMADIADEVYLVVSGIAVKIK